jgi:NAD(P)-dependent dehydrogenase (short-subunit alcohol dehydrogenase family)
VEIRQFAPRVPRAPASASADQHVHRAPPAGTNQRGRPNTPSGRVGQPDDAAALVVFLASDRARHAVGIEIDIPGGRLTARTQQFCRGKFRHTASGPEGAA